MTAPPTHAMTITLQSRTEGAFKASAIGDALGVPYEFHRPQDLPGSPALEMQVPAHFRRSHQFVPEGTWSDDTAQALALLDSLLSVRPFSIDDFSNRMLDWYLKGAYTPDGHVFDIGPQTIKALDAIKAGVPAAQAGPSTEHDNGCGSLMRVLPVALLNLPKAEVLRLAMLQSVPTHPHLRSQLCCAISALIVRGLLEGMDATKALEQSISTVTDFVTKAAFPLSKDLQTELAVIMRRRERGQVKLGGGYVVDTLWSAWDAFMKTNDLESCLKRAIGFGDDTDSVACVAGGFAGAFYGIGSIPERWMNSIKGMDVLDNEIMRLHSLRGWS
jgi:ADP-ribosyl-[dinitrogen reductase] hydrolase